MTTTTNLTRTAADTIARRLSTPDQHATDLDTVGQSLATGAAGVALLHIERAHSHTGRWQSAHRWLRAATATPLNTADGTSLYFGAPAVAFALHTASADGTPRYADALASLDTQVRAVVHRRVDLADARIARGEFPPFGEYDLLGGLTGLGAHLLQHTPHSDALGRILDYLVRLTTPLRTDHERLPGWWTSHDPHRGQSRQFPGGHANFGMGHGIAGPLALLSAAQRRGITVPRHTEAIDTITAWLDTWRQNADAGPWWPQWITRSEHATGRSQQPGPLRPSWCYGTPGLARAQHLAALATGDAERQQFAEGALTRCVSDPAQLDRITDTSLCHGWAGLYLTTVRTARDSLSPALNATLPSLTERLIQNAHARHHAGIGLLEGDTGLALALDTATNPWAPSCGWDACLLIT